MRDFVFVLKSDETKKAILKVDIIDDESEKFTLMYMSGFSGTMFEKYLPWKIGDVIDEDEINDLFSQFQPIMKCVKYGEDSVKTLGVEEHELTITPTITNGAKTFIIVSCENEYGVAMKKTVPLTSGVPSIVEIVEGFEYSFELVGTDTWTLDAPEPFTCDGNEAVSLAISIPIVLPVHTLTITPAVTNGSEASVIINGTKEGYSNTEIIVPLEDGVESVVGIYEGYSYDFVLPEGSSWTGGDAPETIVCDDDKAVTLDISIPIDLPVHTLTITPTLTGATETSVMLIGTLAGYSSTNTPVTLEDGVDVDVVIYEGYSYEFSLDSDDSWTSSSAPAAIVCDGDETAALAITVVA